MAADLFYLGATWELRRQIGTLDLLQREPAAYPTSFRRSDAELRRLMTSPEVFASIETVLTANRNIRSGLLRMQDAASDIISILRDLD